MFIPVEETLNSGHSVKITAERYRPRTDDLTHLHIRVEREVPGFIAGESRVVPVKVFPWPWAASLSERIRRTIRKLVDAVDSHIERFEQDVSLVSSLQEEVYRALYHPSTKYENHRLVLRPPLVSTDRYTKQKRKRDQKNER